MSADFSNQLQNFHRSCLHFRIGSGIDLCSTWNMDQTFQLHYWSCNFYIPLYATSLIHGQAVPTTIVEHWQWELLDCKEELHHCTLYFSCWWDTSAYITFRKEVESWDNESKLHSDFLTQCLSFNLNKQLDDPWDNYCSHLGADTQSLPESLDTDICYVSTQALSSLWTCPSMFHSKVECMWAAPTDLTANTYAQCEQIVMARA